MPRVLLALLILGLACVLPAATRKEAAPIEPEAERVVNVYSARHYDIDDALFKRFTEQTGIRINLIEAGSDVLLERLRREGDLSPADVFITVDAGRLHQAEQQGIFAPIQSELLNARIPASLRHPEGLWYGLSQRVRVLLVAADRVPEGAITSYEDLAKPEWRGRVLIRSSANVYNQSLVASLIHHLGEQEAEAWCKAVVANLARSPQGGDTDQIKALAAGEGDVAVSNHYYFARLFDGSDADKAIAARVRLIFPNQDGRGAHTNICGAGVVKTAPNRENAIRFIEFLAGDEAQKAFAIGNYEYPVVKGIETSPVLRRFGEFKPDTMNASIYGTRSRAAVRIMDRVGWR